MLIITIRTDKPEAEIGLYRDKQPIDYLHWLAHRELAETIHYKIEGLVSRNGLSLSDISGIACFQGPGSFTGLRIGLSVANALSVSLKVPIVASQNENWITDAVARLENSQDDTLALPEYGSLPNITVPKK